MPSKKTQISAIPSTLTSYLGAKFVPLKYDPKGSKVPLGDRWERFENLKDWAEVSQLLEVPLLESPDGLILDPDSVPTIEVSYCLNRRQHNESLKKYSKDLSKIIPLRFGRRFLKFGGIGISLGKESGNLLAIDHDYAEASLILEKWEQENSNQVLPDTLRFTSGKKGCYQMLFRVPIEYQNQIKSRIFYVKNEISGYEKSYLDTEGKEHHPQLDCRWTNRQSVIWGKHPTMGDFYRFENDCEIAELPGWLCEKLIDRAENKSEICQQLAQLSSEDLDRDFYNLYLVLEAYTPSELDWYEWRDVLFACHYHSQLLGSTDLGRELALSWSERSTKHTAEGFDSVWNFIKGNHPNPITAAAICYRLRSREGYAEFFKSCKKERNLVTKKRENLVTKKEVFREAFKIRRETTIFDRFESLKFDGDDPQTDSSCLKDLKVWDLIRSEEGAKEVYKYKINQSAIFNLFLKYYPQRFIKVQVSKGSYSFYFYEKYYDSNAPDTVAYYWCEWSKEVYHSRIWRFAKALLAQVREQISIGDWDNMTNACDRYFDTLLSQDLCTLPHVSKPIEDTRYRPYLNGLYDLENKELIPYSSKIFTISVIPFYYKEITASLVFDSYKRYIKSSLQRYSEPIQEDFANFLIEVLFLAMVGKASCLKLFLWLTAPSNSGKTSFVDLLRTIVDPAAVVSVSASDPAYQFPEIQRSSVQQPLTFLDPTGRFKNRVFEHAYLISCDDEKGLKTQHMGELKKIVSINALMPLETKFSNAVQSIPVRSLLIFTGETDPSVSFTDRGGINRLILWDYSPNIECYREFSTLLANHEDRQELDSFLVTKLDYKTIADKYQTLPDFVKQRQQQFREDYDPITQFFKLCCDQGKGYYVPARTLYSVFQRFDENCIKYKKTEAAIGKLLKSHFDRLGGDSIQIKRTTKNKVVGVFYLGLKLKPWEEIEEHLHFFDDYGGDKAVLKQIIEKDKDTQES